MGKKEKAEARAKRRKNKLIKKIVIWVVVLVGVGALIFYLAGSADEGGDTTTRGAIPEVSAEDWIKWNPDASVTLVEYSDFQCPACASYFPLINAVGEEYSDRVRFVYRHFPLTSIHFNAVGAARAAEAAGKQGKFWEMHDLLFQTQELWASLSPSDASALFAGYARDRLQLDVDQFKTDYGSDEVEGRVSDAIRSGTSSGINSTPSLFINGERIRNPSDIEGFRVLLDEALTNAESGA